jgi:hypothetical protein
MDTDIANMNMLPVELVEYILDYINEPCIQFICRRVCKLWRA